MEQFLIKKKALEYTWHQSCSDILTPQLVLIYEAQTQHQRCHTRVQRGDAQGTPLPAHLAASRRRIMPHGFSLVLADSCWRGFDSGRIGRNGRFKPKFQKKKKRCETHCLSQILNPTFSSLHTNTPNKLSTSLSLRHSSLTLSASFFACYETLNQCRVSHLTHFSSFLLQLSHSLTHS